MRIQTQDYNGVMVAEMQGELDGEFSEQLQRTLTEIVSADKSGVVLDMSKVSFVDSKGLERLLWAVDYCDENSCQLRLAGLDENCSKILEITRLEDRFDKYTELSKAVKSFA